MARLPLFLLLFGCSKAVDPPNPIREVTPSSRIEGQVPPAPPTATVSIRQPVAPRQPPPPVSPSVYTVQEKPDGNIIQYWDPKGPKAPVEDRAYSLVTFFTVRDGLTRRFVRCKPWRNGGSICDICYDNTGNYYAQNRVWCGEAYCEGVTENTDPRLEDVNWNLGLKE